MGPPAQVLRTRLDHLRWRAGEVGLKCLASAAESRSHVLRISQSQQECTQTGRQGGTWQLLSRDYLGARCSASRKHTGQAPPSRRKVLSFGKLLKATSIFREWYLNLFCSFLIIREGERPVFPFTFSGFPLSFMGTHSFFILESPVPSRMPGTYWMLDKCLLSGLNEGQGDTDGSGGAHAR